MYANVIQHCLTRLFNAQTIFHIAALPVKPNTYHVKLSQFVSVKDFYKHRAVGRYTNKGGNAH